MRIEPDPFLSIEEQNFLEQIDSLTDDRETNGGVHRGITWTLGKNPTKGGTLGAVGSDHRVLLCPSCNQIFGLPLPKRIPKLRVLYRLEESEGKVCLLSLASVEVNRKT